MGLFIGSLVVMLHDNHTYPFYILFCLCSLNSGDIVSYPAKERSSHMAILTKFLK